MNRPLFYCSLAFSSVCGASLYKHHDVKNHATKLVVFMGGSSIIVSGLTFCKKFK